MFEETHTATQAVHVIGAPTPMLAVTSLALDDPSIWLRYSAFEPPLAPGDIAAVQTEIDGIIGQTRENNSIAKLVWNGDVRFWKQFHNTWDATGRAVGDVYKRPQVLYRTIIDDNDLFIRDAFPPRWLIMTRIEPEQYADTWAMDSKFFCPERQTFVQLLPSEVPKERYIWFMTVANHIGGCCQRAAAEDRSCYGKYAHPRSCLDELRNIRRGMEEQGIFESHPFDSPDRITRRIRERSTNNYTEQAMNSFIAARARAIDETPMAVASPTEFMKSPDLVELRRQLSERAKRDADKLEKDLKRRQTT